MHSPSLPSRLAFLCLLAQLLALPLLPADSSVAVAKHVVFLGLGALGLGFIAVDALRGKAIPALGTPTDLGVLLFLATALPAAALARNPGMARYDAGLVTAAALCYLLTVKSVREPGDVRKLYLAVFAAAVIVSLLGLDGYRRFLTADAPQAERRAWLSTPMFAHSYLAAQYLVMAFAGGAVVLLRAELSRGWKLCLAAGLLVIGADLWVIGSRGAYAAVAVALSASVVLYLRSSTRRRHRFVGIALRAGGLAFGILALATAVTWIGAPNRDAASAATLEPLAREMDFSRFSIWRHSVAMAADHLVTGVGIGSFDTTLPRYHSAAAPVPHAHNQFLHVLAERGLLGLVAFVFLLRCGIHAARKAGYALAADDERRPLLLGAVAALSAALVYFLFETPLVWVEAGSLIMVLLALVTRAGCDSREAPAPRATVVLGLVLLAALLAWVGPHWMAYARATQLADDHGPRLAAALTARTSGDEEDAERRFDQLVERLLQADATFPWRTEFAQLAAEVQIAAGRYEDALRSYRLAERRAPGTHRNLTAIGQLLMEQGRYAEAIDPLRRAIISHSGPESVEAYVTLGRAYALSRRFEEAWIVYDDLIRSHYLHVERPALLMEAAHLLAALGRNTHDAKEMLAEYRRLAPEEAAADPELVELEHFIEGQLRRNRPPRGAPARR